MRRPSPALVVAVIALIVAMSGTSYAVSQLPRNTVGAVHLKRNAVTSAKIKRSAVTAAKIRRNAITGAKVRDGSLTAADFSPGTVLQGAPSATVFRSGAIELTGPGFTRVARLSDQTTASGSTLSTGPITVSAPSRLIVNAVVTLNGWSNTLQAGGIQCRVDVSKNGTPVPTETRWYGGAAALSYGVVPSQSDDPGAPIPIDYPVSTTAAVGPGTYDVAVSCQLVFASGSVDQTSLVVFATGQ